MMVWSARSGSELEKNGVTGRKKEEEVETPTTEEAEEVTRMIEEVEEVTRMIEEAEEVTRMKEEAEKTQTVTTDVVIDNGKKKSGRKKDGQMKWTASGTLTEPWPNGPTTTTMDLLMENGTKEPPLKTGMLP
jgi:hypothetical protein